jgi:putative sigma-54 modulation protein
VVLKLDNGSDAVNKITEIKVDIKGKEVFVKKQSKSFEEATDIAVEALRRQLKKHKEKTL